MQRVYRIIACLLILLAVPATLTAAVFGLPPKYGETYLASLGDKMDRLEEASSPRIVVAGGSGVCFNLRSDLLERELPGYEAVNFGLYAGLGTTVMLDLCLPRLQRGDILIFEPELNRQTFSTYFNPTAMWQASDGRGDLLLALPAEYRGVMTGALPQHASAKARYALAGSVAEGDGIYARASVNRYGDMACPGREANRMPGGFDENMPLVFDPGLLSGEFVEKLNTVAAACEKAGVRFYFRFCPMNAGALAPGEEERIGAFYEAAAGQLQCRILGSVEDALMESGWFFDTNFHLNAAGAVAATACLARDLKAELGIPGEVSIAVPVMPTPADVEVMAGDTRDGECFTYERVEAGLRITALRDTGRERRVLTVPVSYQGEPVVGFTAEVFAGNTALQELTLQGNILSVPNGSFDGCSALKRLIMTEKSPSRCTVGKGLLDGTDALIFVPPESVSAYCTNYFWAYHADRIRAAEGGPSGEGEASEREGSAAGGQAETPTGPSQESRGASEKAAQPVVAASEVVYLANGGEVRFKEGDSVTRMTDSSHLRFNTLQGASTFAREGFVLTGWNTQADGSGERIGLGSRAERRQGLRLYAQWAEAGAEEDFEWEASGDEIHILRYLGTGERCVIPEKIGSLPVRRICGGAFTGHGFTELVLPSSLRCIEAGAFESCRISAITLYDALTDVSDGSFQNCEGLQTLHVNAFVAPVYSGSYYDTFSDKYDYLLSLRERKKIVLASGSSGRYGYDSAMIRRALPEYEVVNMGVYAYSNALPQLELIRPLMHEGDILLSAPEFDAVEEQFCVSDRLDEHFWAMMESNYDALAELDLRRFTSVWDSFAAYQRIRRGMAGRSYSVSPANYDDDGNYYAFPTYNLQGDFILPRPNGEEDVRLRHNIADYTPESFLPETIESLNREYGRFLEDGVRVCFSYSPRNRSSLTEASTPEARQELHEVLKNSLCVPVISDMEDYLLSGVYFWLIDSHTSTEGATIRTRRVIEDLRAWLGRQA